MSMRSSLYALACTALIALITIAPTRAAGPNVDWPNVFNDKEGTRYSTLDQINRDNVKTLQVAWVYHTGDSTPTRTIECTPLVIDGIMYITTVNTMAVALDAMTGKEIWRYDPYADKSRKWLK